MVMMMMIIIIIIIIIIPWNRSLLDNNPFKSEALCVL